MAILVHRLNTSGEILFVDHGLISVAFKNQDLPASTAPGDASCSIVIPFSTNRAEEPVTNVGVAMKE